MHRWGRRPARSRQGSHPVVRRSHRSLTAYQLIVSRRDVHIKAVDVAAIRRELWAVPEDDEVIIQSVPLDGHDELVRVFDLALRRHRAAALGAANDLRAA